jgi:hypothetical protein
MKKRIKGPSVIAGKWNKTPEQRSMLVQWAGLKLAGVEGCSFRRFSKRATDNKAFWLGIPDHHKRIVLADGSCKISQQARAVFAEAFLTDGGNDKARMAALTLGLFLALTAPSESKLLEVAEVASGISADLSPEQIERCKAEAEEFAEAHRVMAMKQTFGGNN